MMFFFSSRRRHTRLQGDWSSDVCSSDLGGLHQGHLSLGLISPLGRAAREETRHHGGEIGRASCRERGKMSEDDDKMLIRTIEEHKSKLDEEYGDHEDEATTR